MLLFSVRDLSPCKETEMPNTSSSTAHSERSKRNESSATGAGTSALDRLRYNLSPVASYYKPLMRTFGRRDESSPAKVSIWTSHVSPKLRCLSTNLITEKFHFAVQNKDDFDKDKTPVPEKPTNAATSTRSRLESKYSEVLGRRRRKDRDDGDDDREKTLEPEKPYAKALSKSATSVYMGGGGGGVGAASAAGAKKERTPFRLHRNHSDRTTSNKYRSRPELSLLQGSSSTVNSRANAYDWDTSSRVPNRYNDYETGVGAGGSATGTRQRHYEGRDRDKENLYKSKYEPSLLYADLNTNDMYDDRDRQRRRFMKYKRTGTTAIGNDRRYTTNYRDYDHDLLYGPSTSSTANAGTAAAAGSANNSRFATRKAHGYQRSKTQMFLDSETNHVGAAARTPRDANNNSLLNVGSALFDNDEPKSEQQKEREARRKEIQGLIMKYAQIDDVYNRATERDTTVEAIAAVAAVTAASAANKSAQNKANNNFAGKSTNDLLSIGAGAAQQRSMLALSKTQSVSVMPAMSSTSSSIRSRIPKTLSQFVRNITLINQRPIFYSACRVPAICRILCFIFNLCLFSPFAMILLGLIIVLLCFVILSFCDCLLCQEWPFRIVIPWAFLLIICMMPLFVSSSLPSHTIPSSTTISQSYRISSAMNSLYATFAWIANSGGSNQFE